MGDRSPGEVAAEARALVDELAALADPVAFQELISLHHHVAVALGTSARVLAESGSWSQVAGYAGTTKQAAWSRWRR